MFASEVATTFGYLRRRNSARTEHPGIDRVMVAAAVGLELVAERPRQLRQLLQPYCWVVDWVGWTGMFCEGSVAPAARDTLHNAVEDHATREE